MLGTKKTSGMWNRHIITKRGAGAATRKSEEAKGLQSHRWLLNNVEGNIFFHPEWQKNKRKLANEKKKIINFTRQIDQIYYIPKTHAEKQKAK